MLKPEFLLEMLEKQKPLSEYGEWNMSNLLYWDTAPVIAPYVPEEEVLAEIERNKKLYSDYIWTTLSNRNK